MGDFVEHDELVPTSRYSSLYVKYSSRYSRSKFDLFPAAQPEPEIEMTKKWIVSRDFTEVYIVCKFVRHPIIIYGTRTCQRFCRIPPVPILRWK